MMEDRKGFIQCNICFKWLKNRKNYNRHKRELHAENKRSWHCPEEGCDQTFSRRSHIKKHLIKVHKLYKNANNSNIPKTSNIKTDINGNIFVTVKNKDYSDISEDEEFDKIDKREDEKHTEKISDHSDAEDSLPEIKNIDDFMDYLNGDQYNSDHPILLEENTKTVMLELNRTIKRYVDGNEDETRTAVISYSKNVDIKDINITDIVEEIQEEVNDFIKSKQKANCKEI